MRSALTSVGVDPVQRTVNLGDSSMAEVEEVSDREARSVRLVDHDRGKVASALDIERHERRAGRQPRERVELEPSDGNDHHDALDLVGQQVVDRPLERGEVDPVDVGHRDRERPGPEHLFDVGQHLGGPVLMGAEADDTDGVGAPGLEAARRPVRTVVQALDGGENAVAGRGRHVRMAIHDPGDRLVRDPGEARHVVQRRALA
jgi:hypothetical protein